jgi:hypothetical protein
MKNMVTPVINVAAGGNCKKGTFYPRTGHEDPEVE